MRLTLNQGSLMGLPFAVIECTFYLFGGIYFLKMPKTLRTLLTKGLSSFCFLQKLSGALHHDRVRHNELPSQPEKSELAEEWPFASKYTPDCEEGHAEEIEPAKGAVEPWHKYSKVCSALC